MVRHGQYKGEFKEDAKRTLTPLGIEQSILVGKHLAGMGYTFDKLTHSTMVRARETADHMLEQLGPIKRVSDGELNEGKPYLKRDRVEKMELDEMVRFI